MSSPENTREQIQKVLEPYILPREEVAHRRKILALHLASCVEHGSVSKPLALVQPSSRVTLPAEARGLHREYLKALNANISARKEYEKVREEISRGSDLGHGAKSRSVPETDTLKPLEEHIVKIKLQRKQERLQTVQKHIELLSQKPAASSTFLDPDEVFSDLRPLPPVPKEVVDGLALGDTTGKANLKELIDRLEKQVLRTRLLLKNEEQLFDTVKSRSTVRPENITKQAKLVALNATRIELINWMETELAKAGDETDGEEGGINEAELEASLDSSQMDEQLAKIKGKYSQYLAARKSLLQLVGQKPQPPMLPRADANLDQKPIMTKAPQPVTDLLTPYLESLLSLAHEQKGLISQKSHLNIAIAKQLKETVQGLDHLADESHLLPAHAPSGTSRRKLGFGDSLTTSENLDSLSRVKPWVGAAWSAKLATLEVVTEKIEEGQIALEGTMKALQELDQLLGRNSAAKEKVEEGDAAEDDIWLTEGKPSGRQGPARKHTKKSSKTSTSNDLWAFLDGNLGLFRSNDEPA